jgi:hypothetical protein
MTITPMARAIISKSFANLEDVIMSDPEAPTERNFGLTTLQLCAAWPQGLERLLDTKAKGLLDIWDEERYNEHFDTYYLPPLGWAIRLNCPTSTDILTREGCSIPLDKKSCWFHSRASPECVAVIARNLNRRRLQLRSLARLDQAIPHTEMISENGDGIATYVCNALADAGIPVPLPLVVPTGYTSIYHISSIPIYHFPQYFEQGFRDFKLYDPVGLSPIMVWRNTFYLNQTSSPAKVFETFLWLEEKGFLDQTPEDPWRLGINTRVTGWHYVAAMLGTHYEDESPNRHFENPLAWKMVRKLSESSVTDSCICWCSAEGQGCSPVKSLWKAQASGGGMMCWDHDPWFKEECLRHVLLHHQIDTVELDADACSNLSIQLVRLLTFELLGMTHTCCGIEQVDMDEKRLFITDPSRDPLKSSFEAANGPLVLTKCDPVKAQKVRSDHQEQQNAHQLDKLMDGFIQELKTSDSSPKALEFFLWNHWRRQLSKVLLMNAEITEENEQADGFSNAGKSFKHQ